MARWSCSSTLFKYGTGRCRQSSLRSFAFELRNGGRIRGVAVGVDHPRTGMVRSAQRFGEKALSRGFVLLGSGKEIDVGAGGIHRAIQVTPLAFHPDVRLVHAPAVIGGLQVAA